jgi:hypothetical protein
MRPEWFVYGLASMQAGAGITYTLSGQYAKAVFWTLLLLRQPSIYEVLKMTIETAIRKTAAMGFAFVHIPQQSYCMLYGANQRKPNMRSIKARLRRMKLQAFEVVYGRR